MSKIVIDARIINSSTGRYVEQLLVNLEKIDLQNDYFILVPKKDLDFFKPTNPRFKIIEANFANYSLGEQLGLLRLIKSLQPDLTHFCMPQQPIFFAGKTVTTIHDLILFKTYNSDKNWLIYKFKQQIGRLVFYIVGHKSKHILCPSNFTKQEYQHFTKIPKDKITVTYEGCSLAETAPIEYKPLQNQKFLLYVGQQSDYKNVKRLIKAHQNLLKNQPKLKLVFVGRLTGKNGQPLINNQKWAADQGFKNIIFTDYVNDSHLAWLFKNCAVYVFPSLMEGFGLPGLEAMALGAPLASSNATCLPEIYQNGAHYFDPYNVGSISGAINDILTDSRLRAKLAANGKQIASHYSWHKMAQQTFEIYQSVLKG